MLVPKLSNSHSLSKVESQVQGLDFLHDAKTKDHPLENLEKMEEHSLLQKLMSKPLITRTSFGKT